MILRKIESQGNKENYNYIEEQKDNIIEITLKITLDTNYKNVQSYIEKCKGKKCLASSTLDLINDHIKSEYERNL